MPEPAHKRQLTSTVYSTPLMTPTTDLGLYRKKREPEDVFYSLFFSFLSSFSFSSPSLLSMAQSEKSKKKVFMKDIRMDFG